MIADGAVTGARRAANTLAAAADKTAAGRSTGRRSSRRLQRSRRRRRVTRRVAAAFRRATAGGRRLRVSVGRSAGSERIYRVRDEKCIYFIIIFLLFLVIGMIAI